MSGFWRGRGVLITGISGFVGGHLARALVDQGANVAGLDLVADSPCLRVHGLSGKVPVLVRDLAGDPERIVSALATGNGEWQFEGGRGVPRWRPPEVVFHLAGQSHIAAAQANPLGVWESTVRGTWAVLEGCRQLGGVVATVVASSNHFYGGAADHLRERGVEYPHGFPEEAPGLQSDTYGTSKQMVDALVKCYGRSYKLPVVSLRHLNAFGPADPHISHLVTGSVLLLLDGKPPIIRGNGSARKGYLHVSDITAAYIRAAEQAADGLLGVFNVGGLAQVMSVLAIAKQLIVASGLSLEPEILNEDPSQNDYVEMLDDSAFRATGWIPNVPLADGLEQTYYWYQKHNGIAWMER